MGCDMGCERNGKIKDNPKDFGLGNEKDRGTRKEEGKAKGRIA